VLAGLLRHGPADRLRAAEVRDLLRAVADQPPPFVAPRAVRPPLRRRMVALAGALAVVAALGAAVAATRHGEQASAQPGPAASAPAPVVLPRGFGWWTDPGGFRVAVPSGWRRGPDSAGVLGFTASAAGPSLRISRWSRPPRNIAAGLVAEEHDVRLGSYRRIRIETLPGPPNAVWEYTFQDPHGEPMRGLQRVLTAAGHIYLVEWRAPRTDWAAELPRLDVVLDSFGPAPAG
jgi:hypothetical protein